MFLSRVYYGNHDDQLSVEALFQETLLSEGWGKKEKQLRLFSLED